MKVLLTYFCVCVFLPGWLFSQHFQFSQFYASPTYLNPAFTGANVCSRASINYRQQWSGVPGAFNSFVFAIDHSLKAYKSGIGLQFFYDRAGIGGLNTLRISLLYAYETKVTKKIMGRAGISAGNIQRKVDYSQFTFGDQIARNGAPTSVESFAVDGVNYFDLGAGIILFTKAAWFGVSADHLNKPEQSLLNGSSELPIEIKVHGGYKYTFKEVESSNKKIPEHHSLTFAFNYKKQNKFNQLDLGIYYNKNLFVLGCWYRGIPLYKPTPNYSNNDAVIFLFGLNVQKYKIGYSYDFTLSKLTNAVSRGAHEISMSYQFCNMKKTTRKKRILISCPKF